MTGLMHQDALLASSPPPDAAREAPDGGGGRPGRLRWARHHPVLVALGCYVVLGVIFFWPGLLPGHTVSAADYLWNAAPWNTSIPHGLPIQSHHPYRVGSNPELVDGVTVFEPFLQYTKSVLPHVPLWDPYIMGGMPYLADMQSAVFSPFSLPAYLFPFWWSLGVIALMKVVVAAMGAFLLGRAMGMRSAGAFLCGLVFGFGLFMIAWIPWPLTNVFPLIPWMLLATERLVRRPGVLPAAALAVLVGMQFFGGHPESSVYALLVTGGWFVLRLLQRDGGGVAAAVRDAGRGAKARLGALAATVPRPLVAAVAAVVVGTALAAITILPFLQLLHNSSTLTARPRSDVHVRAEYVFAAFMPNYFPGTFEIETAFYVGALPLMLGVVALFRPRVERVAVAVAGAASVLVVLGIQPLFGLAGRTPGLSETYLSRLTIVYLLCMALLAGWGLDDLVRRRVTRRQAVAAAAVGVGVLVLPLVVVAATGGTSLRFLGRAVDISWLFARNPLPHAPHVVAIVRLAAVVTWCTVAVAAVVLLVLRLGGRLTARLFAVLAVALVVGDLFQAGMGYNPAVPDTHVQQPATGAIRYLQAHQRHGSSRYVGVTPYDTVDPLPPDVNLRYHLYDLRGYDFPVVTRFGRMWQRYVAPPTPLLPLDTPSVPLTIRNSLLPSTMRVLSLFGVRDLLEQKHEPPPDIPGLTVAYDGPDATVYANPSSLPRTWLVGAQQVVPGAEAQLAAIGSAGFDPRHVVLTGHRLPGLPVAGSAPGGAAASGATTGAAAVGAGSPGSARIDRYGAEQVAITAHAARRSELVLSDTYLPGWQVTVNGRPEPIAEVDYLLRGVAVPAGTDRIVFTYHPSSYRAGWMLSLVAAVAIALAVGAAVLVARRRRRWGGRGARGGAGRGAHARGAAPTEGPPARVVGPPGSGPP